MSKLIVLSNRVNLPNKQSPKAVAGGLAVALQEALAKDGGILTPSLTEKHNPCA